MTTEYDTMTEPHPDRRIIRSGPAPRAQRGVALIIGLVLLAIMSMLGISMMSATSLETMMAGGTRELSIAFQAAEAALRDAEFVIENKPAESSPFYDSGSFDDTVTGEMSKKTPEPDFFDYGTWVAVDGGGHTVQSIEYPSTYPEMPAYGQPRYIIRHVGYIVKGVVGQDIEQGGYEDKRRKPKIATFRATARGTSRDGSGVTVLQSYYGKQFAE